MCECETHQQIDTPMAKHGKACDNTIQNQGDKGNMLNRLGVF